MAIILVGLSLVPSAWSACREGCDNTLTNTFLGNDALVNNTTGFSNTATGSGALYTNTTGYLNVADGDNALLSNTTGSSNTATGSAALYSNTEGYNNTATGTLALEYNTKGTSNTANGVVALRFNTGDSNTATGVDALGFNTTGGNNTAAGVEVLVNNLDGYGNTADGSQALHSNTSGDLNVALGFEALYLSTGDQNIGIGSYAGYNLTSGGANIDIGNGGVSADNGIIRIGTAGIQTATFIAGIRGVAIAGGQPVSVNASGKLGVRASSARFKEAIKPIGKASEAILALHPVSFRYKKELDPKRTPQFGLVAEEVAKVDPNLVVTDEKGKPFTVRYEEVNAMLLNEFLKEHRKVEELEATVTQLQAAFKAQAAQIQKVSDQIGAHAAAPRVVANN